jgi:hypothetical protein
MYNEYINYIKSFVYTTDINEWSFKSHHAYREILEHVTKNIADAYLFEINDKFKSFYNTNKNDLIDICHENDLYGNPNKNYFDNFTLCSPTNLRYIFHSLLILTFMKKCMLTNIDVIEIGGGYGGLCFFLKKLSKLFDININTYSIFDLPEPLMLQRKYLEKLNINNVNCIELDSIQNIKENSFLISNYAFSEISIDLQKKYTTNILNPYVSYGFLAWNFIDVYNFIDNKNITVENEYPLTGNAKNKYVYFTPNV